MNQKQHIEEAKNTHMVHIEDMVIDGGVDGADLLGGWAARGL